jgi:acetylornithine deacetylase/succinyl-diaminopimelate desuccinylase-like protein
MGIPKITVLGLIAAAVVAFGYAADSSSDRKLFYDIYKEMVETNTTHSTGDTTQAARAVQKRLIDAGFTAEDVQLFEPFPKKGNLVARFKGTGAKEPILLLAHLDVVEAKREDWKTDPFVLQEDGGNFTARGAIDDKSSAAAFVSILVQLRREGFRPTRDIILALTADEERLDVPTNGAAWLVNNKAELVRAAYGISEGGQGELLDGKAAVHKMELAEKQFMTVELETTNPGGHAARPTKANAIYELTDALNRIAQYEFPVHMTETARLYFEGSAKVNNGELAEAMRTISRDEHNADAIERISTRPDLSALLRSTCVATMLQAGHAENALPQRAKATLNCRILPGESAQAVEQQLRQLAGPKVTVRAATTSVPAPASAPNPEIMRAMEKITQEMWPGVPVVPFMTPTTTDMRWFRNAGIPMYGITGMFVDPVNNGTHGLNEHIGQKQLYDGREFLYRLVKMVAS